MIDLLLSYWIDLFNDFNLVLKIFAWLSIILFLKNSIQNNVIRLLSMAFLTWFIIFDQWRLFGGIYFLYCLLVLGLSGTFIDIFFVMQGVAPGGAEQSPGSSAGGSSKDVAQRQAALAAARKGMGG